MKSQNKSTTAETFRTVSEHPPEILEQIRSRAHELFERRGGEHGRDLEDWLQAESEVTQQKVKTTAA